MADIALQKPNGRWCLYSTSINDFVLEDAIRSDIIEYKLQQEREELEAKLDEIEKEGGSWYDSPVTYEGLVFQRDCIHDTIDE